MSLYLGDEPISAYVSGTENGRTAYVHIKYSNDGSHIIANPTAAQRENAYYIGFRADYEATASNVFNDYGWTRVRHDSEFLHLKFSPVANPSNAQITDEPDANTHFIGMYVDAIATDSTQASVYHWTRIAYDQCYMHIKYSTSSTVPTQQSQMSDTPSSSTYYVGICWDRNSAAPTTPASYNWTQVRDTITIGYSNDGVNAIDNPTTTQKQNAYFIGVKINNGNYTWTRVRQDVNSVYIKYATKEGSNYTEVTGANIATATYIGFCSTTATTAPSNLSSYTWSELTKNTHIRYGRLNNSNAIEFVNSSDTATHIGFKVDSLIANSNTVGDYNWTQIRQPLTYLHVRYATNSIPTSMAQIKTDPTNCEFIGIAITTDSANAPNDPSAYDWMRVKDDLSGYVTTNVWNSATLTSSQGHTHNQYALSSAIPTVPTRLSDFTDDLGSTPTHTHSQYVLATGGELTASAVSYTRTLPTSANTNGLKFVLCSSEPTTKYNGWVYLIEES